MATRNIFSNSNPAISGYRSAEQPSYMGALNGVNLSGYDLGVEAPTGLQAQYDQYASGQTLAAPSYEQWQSSQQPTTNAMGYQQGPLATQSTFNQDMINNAAKPKGLFGNGQIDNSEAYAAGTLIQLGAQTAEGLVEGSKRTKEAKRREEKAMSDLAEARRRRDYELAQQARADEFKKRQQEWANAGANFSLRMDMLENDLAKEMQAFQDKQNLIRTFRQATAGNEAFKTAIAQRMARS